MKKRRLFWQILIPFTLMFAVFFLVTAVLSVHFIKKHYLERLQTDMLGTALPLTTQTVLTPDNCLTFKNTSLRLTLINNSGIVLCDSQLAKMSLLALSDRPEIQNALLGHVGIATRVDEDFKDMTYYVALPIKNNGAVLGVVRLSKSLTVLHENLRQFTTIFILLFIASATLCALISFLTTRTITEPLDLLESRLNEYAQMNFGAKLPLAQTREIADVYSAATTMSQTLDVKIGKLTDAISQMKAVFLSMSEGVVAIDLNENVLRINKVAAEFFGVDVKLARKRPYGEIIRFNDFQDYIAKCIKKNEARAEDITVFTPGERQLKCRSTPLKDEDGNNFGTLIVFDDVTHINKLESLRRDFAANASHELKTPLTTIKGFVETLLEENNPDSQTTKRFLTIIAKQTNHLHELINDLLNLSKIERLTENSEIDFSSHNIEELLDLAINVCRQKRLMAKNVITAICAKDLAVKVNAPLVEQAVINLVDNAMKYGGENCKIHVEAYSEGDHLVITVADNGVGIAEEHQARLFERFYRVDKSRNRESGGTGLGLAIVKHIAEAHRGSVSVESDPGKGCTFKLIIPRA